MFECAAEILLIQLFASTTATYWKKKKTKQTRLEEFSAKEEELIYWKKFSSSLFVGQSIQTAVPIKHCSDT